jgi:ketosteroid isomerase-like protein
VSSTNVELVRQLNHAIGAGSLESVVDLWHPDITWRAIDPSDAGVMGGRERVRRYVQDWLDTFEDLNVHLEELLNVEDDHVVAMQRTTGRARLSGIETDLRYAVVYTIHGGRIAGVREYRHRPDALKAVGLEE